MAYPLPEAENKKMSLALQRAHSGQRVSGQAKDCLPIAIKICDYHLCLCDIHSARALYSQCVGNRSSVAKELNQIGRPAVVIDIHETDIPVTLLQKYSGLEAPKTRRQLT